MLISQVPTIVGMVKGCSSVNVLENTSEVPEGCGSQVLSSSLTIYILVKVSIKDACLVSETNLRLSGQSESR